MSEPVQDRPKYLTEHLSELRRALIRSGFFALAGMALAFWRSDLLFAWLLRPFLQVLSKPSAAVAHVHELQTLNPTEAFMVDMKLAAIAGILLASPFLLVQIWSFVSPALKAHERGAMLTVFILFLAFFFGGLAFGYYLIVPMALDFLIRYNLDFHFIPQWTLQGYFAFVVNFLLIFGFLFELPLVLAALVSIGIATPAFLSQKRKHAVVGSFILALFVAPSADPVTQTIVAVPLILLYEIGILLSKVAFYRRNRHDPPQAGSIDI
ncbi:MAG TPA: twin-arginine translocase subunit TatC [bacterium]|nr:twin-arginine translocase subunit TatC [bacterium]